MAQCDESERALKQRILSLAEGVAASMGLEVVLLEIRGKGRAVVRVYVDQPGGVTLDDCERFSRRFSVLLDVEDWIPFSYVLEISSPGLDRPLVKEEDFRRFSGRNAKVRTKTPVAGRRNFKGKILGASKDMVGLEIAPEQRIEIQISAIEKANLVIDI
jgi:ribosome maturation factor RimP